MTATMPPEVRSPVTWINSRYADLLPLAAFVILLGGVYLVDRERAARADAMEREAEVSAERQAGLLADELGNVISERLGALASLELHLSPDDTAAERELIAAFDTVVARLPGLVAISVIDPATESMRRGTGAVLGRASFSITQDTIVRAPMLRAVQSGEPAATVMLPLDRPRVIVFDPVSSGLDEPSDFVLAAELDPGLLVRSALLRDGVEDSIRGSYYELFGPAERRATPPAAAPPAWPRVERPVRVADSEWRVTIIYPPVDLLALRAERVAIWASGLALAVALALILFVLRRTVATQREELARRRAAEQAAHDAADEASRRAREARELAAQLRAAHRASQQLSTSLNPDDVVDMFLGAVAEILEADVASLYTFEDEGEVIVGRRRVVLRDAGAVTDRLRHEDIRQIRAPIALLPVLAEAVATGEPYVIEDAGTGTRAVTGLAAGPEAAAASVTVPLLVAGHTVGVATWEIYSRARTFPRALIAFAQALAAPAAAALRTAELFASVERERLRAEREALRFAAVLDQMADGVVVVDADGRVERSNKAATELLGEAVAETTAAEWTRRFDLVSLESRPLAADEIPLVRALKGERVRRATFIIRSDWGTERHLSGSAAPIHAPSGERAGAAMVLRDISDEHQYAEMLRHTNRELRRQAEVLEEVNRQLREATKAKDQFLAVMSHELRTPINAIMGYTDLLDLGVKGGLNEEQRAMVARVRETSRHLLGLINEVLDLAKIGAGRVDLVMVELPVDGIIDRAVQQITPMAVAKGLRLEIVEPPEHQRPVVFADETRLTQIIINLLSNAVKFTPRGNITVRYADLGDVAEIRVRDTGPGIPRDQQNRVFEEFYQVEGGLARPSGGTGLGLAIARRFARLMGGDVQLESEPGDGSEFVVTLPLARHERASEPVEHAVALLAHTEAALERTRQDLASQVHIIGATDAARFAPLVRRGVELAAVDARLAEAAAWRALAGLIGNQDTSAPVLLFAHVDEAGVSGIELGTFRLLARSPASDAAADAVARAAAGGAVMISDDDVEYRRALARALAARELACTVTGTGDAPLQKMLDAPPDVAVLGLVGRETSGIALATLMRRHEELRRIPVFLVVPPQLSADDMQRLGEDVESLMPASNAGTMLVARMIQEALETAAARTDAQPMVRT